MKYLFMGCLIVSGICFMAAMIPGGAPWLLALLVGFVNLLLGVIGLYGYSNPTEA